MLFDPAARGKRSLDMQLRNQLMRFGLATQVFAVIVADNTYADSDKNTGAPPTTDPLDPFNQNTPDISWQTSPRLTTKVMMGNSISGLDIGPMGVSSSDKTQTEFEITCIDTLQMNEKLTVTYPDGRVFNLQIVKCLEQNDLSAIDYQYTARLT